MQSSQEMASVERVFMGTIRTGLIGCYNHPASGPNDICLSGFVILVNFALQSVYIVQVQVVVRSLSERTDMVSPFSDTAAACLRCHPLTSHLRSVINQSWTGIISPFMAASCFTD